MVGLGGLEPPTSPLSGARSSHLSYRPNVKKQPRNSIRPSTYRTTYTCGFSVRTIVQNPRSVLDRLRELP
jgi:hypothetical protein